MIDKTLETNSISAVCSLFKLVVYTDIRFPAILGQALGPCIILIADVSPNVVEYK